MGRYVIDSKVLPGLGAGGHIDKELGRCRPGEVIEATKEQADARSWLKRAPAKESTSKKKSTKTTKAAEDEAANAKE